MPKVPSPDDLIKSNPKVDAKRLAEFDALGKKLSEIGIVGTKYKLASPVVRRHIVVGESDRTDPRTIRVVTRH